MSPPFDSSRADEQELASLHGLFAQFLKDRLQSGEVSAGELNCIRQFLKDNGIDCAGKENPNLQDITKGLPTFADDDEADAAGDRLLN